MCDIRWPRFYKVEIRKIMMNILWGLIFVVLALVFWISQIQKRHPSDKEEFDVETLYDGVEQTAEEETEAAQPKTPNPPPMKPPEVMSESPVEKLHQRLAAAYEKAGNTKIANRYRNNIETES